MPHILLWWFSEILFFFLALGAVAFITLLERKLLGLSHARLGPNKVTLLGLLQPLADGVKLLFKQLFLVSTNQMVLFCFIPMVMFSTFLLIWAWAIPWWGLVVLKYPALLMFVFIGLGTYVVILVGWSSTSIFAKLGSMRGMLQGLSFEVGLVLIFMIVLAAYSSFKVKSETHLGEELILFWGVWWVLLSLMESNRAPFDLLEGESELISGFNLEMGSLMFVFLFLSEYGMIIVMSLITSFIVWDNIIMSPFVAALMVFIRSCYPRVRYDSFMGFMWQDILPAGICMLFIFIFLK